MIEREDLSSRLTPRAAELLASLLDEMREEVLESAARRGVGLEISARDIIEAFEERTGEQRLYNSLIARRRGRVQLLLTTYALIAGALAIGAIVAGGATEISSEWTQLLSSMSIAIVGASLGLLLVTRRREMRASSQIREEERRQSGFAAFMDRWLRIESLLRLLVAKDMGTSAAEMPLGAILDASLTSGRIDRVSHEAFRELLSIRNQAVHGGEVDQDALVMAIQSADRLVDRFEDQLAR